MRDLSRHHLASDIGVAKSQIREKEPVVWKILQEVMQGYPVLLNRGPALHTLGILAFQPILVEGHAICLHPLICKGFNADFDRDQMAVHVFVQIETIHEITKTIKMKELMIIIISIQNNPFFFGNSYDAIRAYHQKRINLDSPLWLWWRLDQHVIASREAAIKVHYESLGTWHKIYGHHLIVRIVKKKEILFIYIRTTVGHIYLYREIEEAIQGFYRAYSYGT
ncbi:hypothetical protein Cgig2_028250 [Carnegiea gigantea]|uniref:DNA-directed RNA polymerase n=1 Tax=Carnegiea gigantea TaxID=171969 RepID=A0A9Q1GN96_9CARY|nr:hypothetical protein Cgig2_028250 [Carnegiea gigantea]